MMTKEEHITYWVNTAEDDWEAVKSLFDTAKYLQCLFFAHLVLEKYCKAHWVKDNSDNFPPRTHNLVRLLDATSVDLGEEDLQFLEEFNDFQLEGRYPDYLSAVQRRCNQEYTNELLEKVKSIKICLQEMLS
jgi:HEPN domain-containing protein